MNAQPHESVPGLEPTEASRVSDALSGRLTSLLDLQLTLSTSTGTWSGPNFLSVHEMLDTHGGPVRGMTDAVAERIRTLGGVPMGTPAAIVAGDLGRLRADTESVYVHLKALEPVFAGIVRTTAMR